ncbi:MAG: hypothetical protein AB1640_21160 [bacterium]
MPVAALVGLIYFLPHVLFILDCWPDYHYPFLGSGDERGYCSQIRHAGEEGFLYSSPYFVEYERGKVPPFSSTIGCTALAARALGIPFEQVPVVLDFVAPAAVFLLLYALLVVLTGSVWLSALGAAAVLLTSLFTLGIPNMLLLAALELFSRLGVLTSYRGFPIDEIIPNTTFPFARLINPQVNFLSFGGALVFLALLAKRARLAYAVGFGLCCGFLFYVAPFYWMYLLTGTGLFGIFLAVRRDWPLLKFLCIAFFLALLIGVPWLYSTFLFFQTPEMKAFTDLGRLGLHTLPRAPFLAESEVLPVLVFLVFYPSKDRRYFFLACLLVGGLICENQHLVTGRQFGLFKYVLYVDGPVVWVALFTLIARFPEVRGHWGIVRRIRGNSRKTALALLALLVANGVGTQLVFYLARERRPIAAYEASAQRWKQYQSFYPDFEWLKHNATDRDVVLASDEVSTLLPCFTQVHVLVLHFAYSTPGMTEQELLERWFIKFRFFGLTPDEIGPYLDKHVLTSTNTPSLWYIDPRWGKLSFFDRSEYENVLARVSAAYREFCAEDLLQVLKKYHVTLVWLSAFEDEEFGLAQRGVDASQRPWLERLYESSRARIYRVRYPSETVREP